MVGSTKLGKVDVWSAVGQIVRGWVYLCGHSLVSNVAAPAMLHCWLRRTLMGCIKMVYQQVRPFSDRFSRIAVLMRLALHISSWHIRSETLQLLCIMFDLQPWACTNGHVILCVVTIHHDSIETAAHDQTYQ